jgi:hypothetical protein
MAILPDRYEELIGFLQVHAGAWAGDPGAIGLSEEEVQAVADATEALRAARAAAVTARMESLTATQVYRDKLARAREAAATALDAIKLYARTSGEGNAVYTAAMIPVPDSPSPLPPPGTPVATGFGIDESGALTLRWKCRNPRGSRNVVYLVQRRTPTHRNWEYLGAAGVKRFTDHSLPAGTPWAEYKITARRGAKEGRPCIRRVNLGSVETGATARLAA